MKTLTVVPMAKFLEDRAKHEKRRAVKMQADELLACRPTRIYFDGELYDFDDLMAHLSGHPLFPKAIKSAYISHDAKPIKDLMLRIARKVVCEYMFEGEAEDLGFMS